MKRKERLTFEHVWSLMDRLLLLSGLLTCGFAAALLQRVLHGAAEAGLIPFMPLIIACLLSGLGFLILSFIRALVFAPDQVFARLCDTVFNTILEPERLQDWEGRSRAQAPATMDDLYGLATDMLDSTGDFYTCLLSPQPAAEKPSSRSLGDCGLSFGMKRAYSGRLVFDAGGNLLPEQDREGRPVVRSVIFESPAYRAGLRPGDVVLRINDGDTSNRSLAQLLNLNGLVSNQSLSLTVSRREQEFQLTIKEFKSPARAVSWEFLSAGAGCLSVANFDGKPEALFKSALKELSGCTGFLIDLRGNRGGDIRNAMLLLSAFNKQGVLALCERRIEGELRQLRFVLAENGIALEEKKAGGETFSPVQPETLQGRISNLSEGKPVVVLVDSYSMSGAELFAGAMRDLGRARIVGEKTFGKGVGQDVIGIPPCVKVSVTSMRFTTPSGVWPGDGAISVCNGIEPDEIIAAPDGIVIGGKDDFQLKRALELLASLSAKD